MKLAHVVGCCVLMGYGSLVGAMSPVVEDAVEVAEAINDDEQAQQCVSVGQWVEGKTLKPLQQDVLLKRLLDNRVVILGEDHNNVEHHRWQLHTIAKLHALHPNMALGFESFPRSAQPILDQWVQGELTEQAFLKAVDWETIWVYNADFYLPMFHFARMNKIPMYAMNVTRGLVSLVGKEGWVNVPEKDREGVTDPAPPDQQYMEILAEVYSQHATGTANHGHGSDPAIEPEAESVEEEPQAVDLTDPGFLRFVQGQQLWDRAMAQVAHEVVSQDKDKLFVAVVGAGHIMGGSGVPHQLASLGTEKNISLLAWDGVIDCEQLSEGLVDVAYGTALYEEPPEKVKPRIGVFLEQAAQGVSVSRLVEDSIAEKIGIKPNDIIKTAAGKPMAEIADVVKVVQNTAFGTWLPLTIIRDGKDIDMVAKFPAVATDAE